MRSLLLMFGALLLIICLPLFFLALHDGKVDTYSQNYAEILTVSGVTSANVTLSYAPWGNHITSVLAISSNITADTPTASDYNNVSRGLTVSGLKSSAIRTLSVEYEIASTNENIAVINPFLTVTAVIYVLSILGIFGRAIYELFT